MLLSVRRWQSLVRRLSGKEQDDDYDKANNFVGYSVSTAGWSGEPSGGRTRYFKKYATDDDVYPRRVLLVVVPEVSCGRNELQCPVAVECKNYID